MAGMAWRKASIRFSRAAIVVNQDGEGARDLGVRGGPHRRDRRPVRGLGRQGGRLHGPAYPARRDRHPGAFPRARRDPQGRPRIRLAQRGDGRRHRRVRDAEHRSAHHHAGGARRQGEARRIIACIATSPSSSAARTTIPGICRNWSGCRAAPASRCSWARPPARCWSGDEEGLRNILKVIRRRASFHAEDEPRLNERKPLRVEGDASLASGLARSRKRR